MMTLAKFLFAAVGSALLFAAPIAIAANPNASTTKAADENKTEHENKAELAAFQNIKMTLGNAISAAEKHAGGKALDVSFEDKGGTPAYNVKTYQNNAVWEGKVDANSGQVIGQGKTIPESQLDQEDKAELTGLHNAKVALAQAVGMAEKHANGKAIDAGLEERNGKVAYEIEIVKNGAIQTVMVDPASGQVTAAQAGSGSSTQKQ
jgi:uncharacterized membrane protein YkoI